MKTRTVRSKVVETFPFVNCFGDYHEIDWERDRLKKHFGNICSRELCCDGMYWTVFWIRGERPTRKDVIEMLKNANCDVEFIQKEREGINFR